MNEVNSQHESLLYDPVTKEPFEKIAVFRSLSLGDLLCSVPAFRALRKALPKASITLIGLPWAENFVSIYKSYIDHFIEFPGYPGLPERSFKAEAFFEFLRKIHAEKFDLTIQMHGSGIISNPLISLFGSRYCSGFFALENFCPDRERFLPHIPVTHEVWRYLELVRFLGAKDISEEIDFFLQEKDFEDARSLRQFDSPYICLHPGAKEQFRCWPVEKFAELGDCLSEFGFRIVLTGTANEIPLSERLQSQMRFPSVNLVGKTDLRTLGALIQESSLLVCNDTGVSHLAVALKHPSVVVLTRSEFLGWPPLNRQRHRVVSRLSGVTVQDVLQEALELISEKVESSINFRLSRKESHSHEQIKDSHMAYSW